MIPRAHIAAWREHAPWPADAQVEQDLVLSRALVELFSSSAVADAVAFRGGTALHKLFLASHSRYSEDIDLVQVSAGNIGPVLDAIRATLDPWLRKPKTATAVDGASLVYRFETTSLPVQQMRLKIEMNTREHFTVVGYRYHAFEVANPWFSGRTELRTYELEELLGTKLRALYQRKKGRDLYDLWLALQGHDVKDDRVIECFERYMQASKAAVSRAQFEKNLAAKVKSPAFSEDMKPLVRDHTAYDPTEAAALVSMRLVSKLKGKPWKGKG